MGPIVTSLGFQIYDLYASGKSYDVMVPFGVGEFGQIFGCSHHFIKKLELVRSSWKKGMSLVLFIVLITREEVEFKIPLPAA